MIEDLKDLIILDIETVSEKPDFDQLDYRFKELWEKKASFLKNEQGHSIAEQYFDRAAIYAEFGKIITIALGYFQQSKGDISLRIKSCTSHSEPELLNEFVSIVKNFDKGNLRLCAHNGKEFDYPYICRRLLVNRMDIPECLNIRGKKPWEVNHIDTMEMWKFGDYKSYSSLDLLTAVLSIPSSKQDIDGSQVNTVYYHQNGLDKISKYCQNDVIATANLYLRLNNHTILTPHQIITLN